jgi:hypothetical protein
MLHYTRLFVIVESGKIMNKYKQTFTMFQGNQVSDFLEHNTNRIQYETGEAAEDYILNVNEEEYVNYLEQKFTIDTPHIDFDQMSVDSYEDEIPAEYFPQSIPAYFNQGKSYPKQVIVYHLPYTGNSELFKYTPRSSQMLYPEVYLQSNNVCFDIINFNNNPDEIKREADKFISSIRIDIGNVIQEIDAYNSQIRASIQGIFKTRKHKILESRNLLASLGVPLRKRNDLSDTFAIPTPQSIKPLIVKPIVTEKGFKPEPTLDQTTYQEILEIIHSMGKEFEVLPGTYFKKGEEELRDHFLLYLAPRFRNEGSVTGETFSKVGKTDIIYLYENSNVFVAECKFWKGQAQYIETIYQLLSYLTWRDSKAAIIIFVKNKEISSVLETVKQVTPQHSNYLGFINEQDTSWFNYRFHINEDPSREVKLAVMLYHIPDVYGGRVKQNLE